MRILFTALFCLMNTLSYAQINPCEIEDAILVQSFSFAYDPEIITINIGETVAWINTQGYHDVNGEINSITGATFNNPEDFYLPPISGSSSNTTLDELEALSVLIYPNPASNNLTVDLGDLNGVNTTLKLYDSSSKLVFEKKTTSTLMIDVSGFAKGMYSLELSSDEQVLRSLVIID